MNRILLIIVRFIIPKIVLLPICGIPQGRGFNLIYI